MKKKNKMLLSALLIVFLVMSLGVVFATNININPNHPIDPEPGLSTHDIVGLFEVLVYAVLIGILVYRTFRYIFQYFLKRRTDESKNEKRKEDRTKLLKTYLIIIVLGILWTGICFLINKVS